MSSAEEMASTSTSEEGTEAFFVFLGISFGFVDLVILALLIAGGLYYLFGRKQASTTDAADKFKQYSIQ